VQKQKLIDDDEYIYLKKQKYIEGRKPNIYLSYKVIESVNNDELKAEYIANRSFDDNHFKEMIIEYIKKFGPTKRKAIDNLIIPKLSAVLDSEQKKKKVSNLLKALRESKKIKSQSFALWELV
jgi:ATP-dependent DNA helicase RecG